MKNKKVMCSRSGIPEIVAMRIDHGCGLGGCSAGSSFTVLMYSLGCEGTATRSLQISCSMTFMQDEGKPHGLTGPCPAALGMIGVPARRWLTKADLYAQLDQAKTFM